MIEKDMTSMVIRQDLSIQVKYEVNIPKQQLDNIKVDEDELNKAVDELLHQNNIKAKVVDCIVDAVRKVAKKKADEPLYFQVN